MYADINKDHIMILYLSRVIYNRVNALPSTVSVTHHPLLLSNPYRRYYAKPDGQCYMRMVDAEFQYTFEYQGNAAKLVHTPLTDKCYLTLTQVHCGRAAVRDKRMRAPQQTDIAA